MWHCVASDVFNTADFGLPQTRRRMFFFAIRKDLVEQPINFNSELVIGSVKNTCGSTSLKNTKMF